MSKTSIQWTEATINPTMGCDLVSEGCENCYAMKMAYRLQSMGISGYKNTTRKLKSGRVVWTGKINFDMTKLEKALKTKKPTMFFVDSMSDLFHKDISSDLILEVMLAMVRNERHIFQILTKRAERLLEFTSYLFSRDNIWMGVSVENQKAADKRIPILLKTLIDVKWISVEPMLEPINLTPYLKRLSWVVVGCESGPRKRECKNEWIESVVEQCKEAATPVFVKQIQINGNVIKDINKFPKHLKIREYPKRIASLK